MFHETPLALLVVVNEFTREDSPIWRKSRGRRRAAARRLARRKAVVPDG